jgi:hypothetical protein
MINMIETNQILTVSLTGKRPFFIPMSEAEKVKTVKDFVAAGDEASLLAYLDKREKIVSWSDSNIYVEDDQVKIKGDDSVVPDAIAKKIMAFVKQDHPYQPLLKFWLNLRKNPSQDSINQLYRFLEANHMPITPEGKFVAYKKVTRLDDGRLVDSHTNKVSNEIGDIVQMNRDNVDPNPDQTCSSGLHVAAWEYASTYSGNVLIEVEVNPKDVVAVPRDYNNQKMRCCEYTVKAVYADDKPIEDDIRGEYQEDVIRDWDDSEDDEEDFYDEYDLTNLTYEEIENICRQHPKGSFSYYPKRSQYATGKEFIGAATEHLIDAGFIVHNNYGTFGE